MAAGSEASSGHSRGSSAVLESTLDRRFEGVTNTMESIQGLSAWCIENKKYHSLIVRCWTKWLRKSDSSHRLNLFYLANDVIQNCKRKNAMVYRTTFADVLPDAIKIISSVKDSKVRKAVDRILSIWEERNVYTEELINQLKSGLIQKREEPPAAPVNPKASLRSKIVAEFVPSAFIDHLTKYRNSMDEIELKEKQLAAMRVDVCSTEALKKLKDKAGGKRFSRDFEDGSTKLQEFVAFLDGQVKKGPVLLEALENADIFYEMQYKEVKIVTNAYQTFANRVLHLKRKLDTLKASLPNPDESPVPSPIVDAPSPTGSESPFHGFPRIGTPDPELDGQAMEEDLIALGDAPSPLSSVGEKDNRDVEDMELSDEGEQEEPVIIVEQKQELPDPTSVNSQTPGFVAETTQAAATKPAAAPAAAATPTTPSLPISLAGVDLGKISSILSTLTNVMKNSGVTPTTRTATSTSNTPSTASPSLKSPGAAASATPPTGNPLSSMLARVDISPSTLLSVLSKTQPQGLGLQGLSSLINSPAGMTSTPPGSDMTPDHTLTAQSLVSPKTTSAPNVAPLTQGSTPQRVVLSSQSPNHVQTKDLPKNVERHNTDTVTSLSSSLDSKIDHFLQGNPGLRGLNMGFPSVLSWSKAVDSPSASIENLEGTPVRDESGATPTQDEVMDGPLVEPPLFSGGSLETSATTALPVTSAPPVTSMSSMGSSVGTHANNSWQQQNLDGSQFGSTLEKERNIYQRDHAVQRGFQSSASSIAEEKAGHHERPDSLLPLSLPNNNQLPTERSETVNRIGSVGAMTYSVAGKAGDNGNQANDGWYGDTYGNSQEKHGVSSSDVYAREPYHSEKPGPDLNPANFFNTPLPPIPQLPPPPKDFLPPLGSGVKDHTEMPDRAEVQADVPSNTINYEDYDERLTHKIPANESFHPHVNVPGPLLRAPAPRPGPGPQHSPVDYNHQPRAPLHHRHHPGIPHHQLSHPPQRDFRETLSPSRSASEEPYFEPHYDLPPRSPSPPRYKMDRPLSPHSQMYFAEERAPPPPTTLPHPEHRLRPRLEHRPPPPLPYRAPRPGPFPPQRPLRRPPPPQPHVPYSNEPRFQRGKRPGPPFVGLPRAGPFYAPKRPFLPPRY